MRYYVIKNKKTGEYLSQLHVDKPRTESIYEAEVYSEDRIEKGFKTYTETLLKTEKFVEIEIKEKKRKSK